MGLFDRFRRKAKEAPSDEGLFAEPDSQEAQEAISEKLEMAKNEEIIPKNQQRPASKQPTEEEWDEDEPRPRPIRQAIR